MDERYDVIVIGGGAAGLNGALALVRARRRVLVIDSGEPRNAPAGHVHNYLGREGTPPGELLALGRAEVAGYGGGVLARAGPRAGPGDDRFTGAPAPRAAGGGRPPPVTTRPGREPPPVPGLA